MELYFWICNVLQCGLISIGAHECDVLLYISFSDDIFDQTSLMRLLIIGKIVCKISVLQAEVELAMLNTYRCIYCI